MKAVPDGIDWSLTTWEGSRRAQLRNALRLTLRERLEALDGMTDIAEHFRWMRETGKFSSHHPARPASPVAEPSDRTKR